MNTRTSTVSAAVFALALSGTAMAQQATPPVGDDDGYVAAFGGAVTGPATAPVFSVEYAENVHPQALAYVTLAYIDNLMDTDLRDEVAAVGEEWLAPVTGVDGPWLFSGRDRAILLTAGGRYLTSTGRVRPYIGAGAGIINLKRTIREARLGDVTLAVFNDFGVGSAELSTSPQGTTRPLIEVLGGVGFAMGHTYVDVGYKYRRAFRLEPTLDFSQISVGIGYRF